MMCLWGKMFPFVWGFCHNMFISSQEIIRRLRLLDIGIWKFKKHSSYVHIYWVTKKEFAIQRKMGYFKYIPEGLVMGSQYKIQKFHSGRKHLGNTLPPCQRILKLWIRLLRDFENSMGGMESIPQKTRLWPPDHSLDGIGPPGCAHVFPAFSHKIEQLRS